MAEGLVARVTAFYQDATELDAMALEFAAAMLVIRKLSPGFAEPPSLIAYRIACPERAAMIDRLTDSMEP